MANKNFPSAGKIYSMHVMPVMVDVSFITDSSGDVEDFKGPLVSSVEKLKDGVYQIKLEENFSRLININAMVRSPVSGSAIAAGSLVASTLYEIVDPGTTDWEAIGLADGITPAAGVAFVASGAGSGTGTAKAVANSQLLAVEAVGNVSLMAHPSPEHKGSVIIIQTLGPTAADDTALIPAEPVAGSEINLLLMLSNSSVIVKGEEYA